MKKETFVLVMIVEGFAALVSMGLLFSDVGALIYPISLAIFAAVEFPFYWRLKRTEEEAKKRKISLMVDNCQRVPHAGWMATLGLTPQSSIPCYIFLTSLYSRDFPWHPN